MNYKQLETLDYSSEDNYMGEILFNGQRSLSFQKANAKEGWVETLIGNGHPDAVKFLGKSGSFSFLKDEDNNIIKVRLYGKVEIFALDKKGNRIEE